MPKAKNIDREIRAQTGQAALLGVQRLTQILTDPESSNADVFKGLSLLFDHIYQRENGGDSALGDFEIRLKA